jgi:acetyl-CoA carboxylase biotin carboxyl carrier protein
LVNRIRALAEALEGTAIGEVDLAERGTRIVIRRRLEAPTVAPSGHSENSAHLARIVHRARTATTGDIPTPDPTVAIIAPLTGVFYAAPAPTAPPYVQVGEMVQAGQVVCIVEAMKVFNEIKAEVSGTVTTILAEPGQLVRKGDALMRIQAV